MARKNIKTILNIVALLSLLGGLLFTPSAVKAAVITVTTGADEYGEGPACSLREAIQAANTDLPFGGCPAGFGADTIYLGAGTYVLTRTTDDPLNTPDEAYGDLDINTAMTIIGAGSKVGGSTVSAQFSTGYEYRIFHIAIPYSLGPGQVNLQQMIISNGSAVGVNQYDDNGVGGGIYNERSLLSLFDVTVENNKASLSGGGIHNEISERLNVIYSSLGISESTIRNNETTGNYLEGGGGGLMSKGPLAIHDSLFLENKADKSPGGGLRNLSDPSARLVNVTFAGNYSGIFTNSNNEIIGQSGSAIYSSLTLEVINSTIAYNTVQKAGTAAVHVVSGDSVFVNTIVAKNTVVETGLTSNCFFVISTTGTKNLSDGTDCNQSSAFSSSASISLPVIPPGQDIELYMGEYSGRFTKGFMLGADSSAIEAGAQSYTDPVSGKTFYCPGSDYRWAIRPMKGNGSPGDAKCDIGAYEANDFVSGLPIFHAGILLPVINR